MPNDGGSDSPPQYSSGGMQEETGMENIVSMNGQGDASLQNLINRQDQLENAMKMVFTENKRLSKENKMLWTEVTTLKTKQTNTDKVTKAINTQNNQLLKENRCLWSELIMNKYTKILEAFPPHNNFLLEKSLKDKLKNFWCYSFLLLSILEKILQIYSKRKVSFILLLFGNIFEGEKEYLNIT